MKVCDICWEPNVEYSGEPTLASINRPPEGGTRPSHYVFGRSADQGHRIDLCKACLLLLRARKWREIAERADDVIKMRLGVKT